MCLHCLYVSWLSLSSNSGSVEMWKYVFIVLIYLVIDSEVWKCGNVEICLQCLYLVTRLIDAISKLVIFLR